MPNIQKPAGRNPVAKALSNPLFKPKVVKAKKGKASYKRRPKHVKPYADGAFSLLNTQNTAII